MRFSALALTAAVLCLLALADLPYGFYTVLRIAVTATATYGAFLSWERAGPGWVVALLLIAVVFNPVLPVYLGRETWTVVDLAAAAILAAAALRSGKWISTSD